MGKSLSYRHTRIASYIGYVTQAIINNLAPLLFVTFNTRLNISVEKLGLLVSVNFGIQILVDFLAARYILKIGYRKGAVLAHILCTTGLVLLGILPGVMRSAYSGLIIAIAFSALGGGLLEVLVSPIVESLPGDEKASAMSLLHSFYCWGHVAVVLLSTLYFRLAGIENWRFLPILWAVVPFMNTFLFAKVPLCSLSGDEEGHAFRRLFSSKVFWILFLLMVCAGASEQAMSQWSSMFAEAGLGISKTLGDLLGPCAFAVMMGLGRLCYGIWGSRLKIAQALLCSALLCMACYLLAIFSSSPVLSLVACAFTGLSVALMWPGTFSLAAQNYATGGTAMFAILALAGDLGCSCGPGLVGWIAGVSQRSDSSFLKYLCVNDGIKTGLLAGVIFPLLMILGIVLLRRFKLRRAS